VALGATGLGLWVLCYALLRRGYRLKP